jgi:hypothetical protein
MLSADLIRTCYNSGELAFLLVLALDYGFDDGGMVGSEVDEDMANAVFPEGLEEGEGCCVASRRQQLICLCAWELYSHHNVCATL